ncbi:phage late control D family protein [Phreatobacter stygius]|uniref:Late control protein D n=1 Tax=Phreatobacter stygius TaxID=1940610 RepID=A0A4D7AV46_9HYPH|nr:contractile injection system protein, VgrG/Pvc8 family [Phreatobacter stygius]QCI65624.1 late control protein D [Phreatobacter stygius]
MIPLPQPAEPLFKLLIKGIDVSSELAPQLISCTYTDHVHGKADEIEVEVHDKDGWWRGPWCPEHGDKAQLWIGYKPALLVPAGSFELDEPSAKISRSGDTFSMRGVSAPITRSLRTRRTRGYENQSLRQIAQKIASEHGLTVVGNPPDVQFERRDQRRERDLEFLSRSAEEFGAYFTVKGNQLVFSRRDEVHGRASVLTIEVSDPNLITADLKKGSHRTYSRARASYYEGNQRRHINVEVQDQSVRNGDTLRIDERSENEGQARQRARSSLQRENLKKLTGNLVFVGNPYLLAGQNIALGQTFGKWAGKYVIKQSRHHITRSGYTTNIEVNGV